MSPLNITNGTSSPSFSPAGPVSAHDQLWSNRYNLMIIGGAIIGVMFLILLISTLACRFGVRYTSEDEKEERRIQRQEEAEDMEMRLRDMLRAGDDAAYFEWLKERRIQKEKQRELRTAAAKERDRARRKEAALRAKRLKSMYDAERREHMEEGVDQGADEEEESSEEEEEDVHQAAVGNFFSSLKEKVKQAAFKEKDGHKAEKELAAAAEQPKAVPSSDEQRGKDITARTTADSPESRTDAMTLQPVGPMSSHLFPAQGSTATATGGQPSSDAVAAPPALPVQQTDEEMMDREFEQVQERELEALRHPLFKPAKLANEVNFHLTAESWLPLLMMEQVTPDSSPKELQKEGDDTLKKKKFFRSPRKDIGASERTRPRRCRPSLLHRAPFVHQFRPFKRRTPSTPRTLTNLGEVKELC